MGQDWSIPSSRAQESVDFPVIYPCWIPSGLVSTANVSVDANVVDIQYHDDPRTLPYPALRLIEQRYQEGFSTLDGTVQRIYETDVIVSLGTGSVSAEWTRGDI